MVKFIHVFIQKRIFFSNIGEKEDWRSWMRLIFLHTNNLSQLFTAS